MSARMDRNLYYVGIAFFGMINGLFNQALVPFAYLFATVLAPGLGAGLGVKLYQLRVLVEDPRDGSIHAGANAVEELHHLDQADDVTGSDALADLDERRLAR